MKLDTSNNNTPIALTSGDTFTVAIKSADGLTTLGTYSYTVGGAATQNGITYTTTGANAGTWSLAVPASAGLAQPSGTSVNGNTYNVDISTTAGVLTRSDISTGELIIVKPVTITSVPEGASSNVLNKTEATDGTTVNLSLVGTGAVAGEVLKIMWDGQPVLVTLTAADIAAGTVAALIPASVLQAATPANTSETLQVSVSLLASASSASAISTSTNTAVNVNFIAPTSPTINNTLWAASGAGSLSDLSGIGEAKYAIDAATHQTTGTTDYALYVSEAYANGTVVRVQLPQAGTGIITPVAGDSLVITWGSQTYVVPTTITTADINAKYVDVTIPYSVISTQPFGAVNVTAQIQVTATGNLSAASPVVALNWAYDMPAALISGTGGFAINGVSAGALDGYSVANAGDVNGDGYDDIIIGSPLNAGTASPRAGKAWVVFGNSTNSFSNFDLSNINAGSGGFAINGGIANAWYGWSVAGAGDIILMDSSFLSQELEQVKPRNPEHLATVQNITDQASRASQILQGIRNFIKPGKTHMTTVALPEVIQSVQAMLKPLLRSHDVKIQVSCHSEHPTIRGDVAQLSQVFLNLLKNSFEARNPSKPLMVSITIEQKEESQEVVIEDDGIGMSDEQLAMCGMPFFTTKSGGMGIGLAISRRIVEHHGGTFAVSRPASGHGLRTTLSFPNSEGQWVAKR